MLADELLDSGQRGRPFDGLKRVCGPIIFPDHGQCMVREPMGQPGRQAGLAVTAHAEDHGAFASFGAKGPQQVLEMAATADELGL